MQKLINDPAAFVDEVLDGLLLAHPKSLKAPARRVLVRAGAPERGKVAIVTGGGSGHLPLFLGYVGQGLADAVAIGDVFSSPGSDQVVEATKAVDGGAGVLYLYGNYSGDVMNFDMAAELCQAEGTEVATILAADDGASAPADARERRRGAAGMRSMGVALSPCTVPAAGRPTFELPVGLMEVGMGIHGEPGVRRGALERAEDVAAQLMAQILADLPFQAGDEVAVLVNGLGATPREELYVLFRSVHAIATSAGLTVRRAWVGEYATSLEMAGASVSLLRLSPDILSLLDAPAASPLVWFPSPAGP